MSIQNTILEVTKMLNDMLSLGNSGIQAAQFIARKLQEFQEEDREPSAEEWEQIKRAADQSDTALREQIRDRQ